MKLTQRTFTDVQESLRRMDCLVGKHAAFIREVFPVEQTSLFSIFHYYNATIGNTQRLDGKVAWRLAQSYAGAAWTREESIAAAIGEAVERYACGVYDKDAFMLAPYRDVAEYTAPLEQWTLYTEEQYRREEAPPPPTPDTRAYWIEGYSLTRQKKAFVPAAFVFVPYRNEPEEDAIVWEASSSGAACGCSLEEAILGGICEVVERDAVMITWLDQLPAPRLRLEEIGHPHVAYALERIACTSYQLVINDVATDIALPTFLATLFNQNNVPPFSVVASACGLDKNRAILKSIIELMHGIQATQTILKLYPNFDLDQETHTLEEHTLLYAKYDLRDRLAFLTENCETRSWDAIPQLTTGRVTSDIELCVQILEEQGYEVVVVDITPPEIVECGLFVVKVVIPGMAPLHSRSTLRPLGLKRVSHLPVKLGYGPRELNPFPHPFP